MVIKDIQAKVYPCIDINISKMEDVEKFISLDIGDIVRVLYNDDTTEKEIEGKLVNIAAKPPVPGYKLSKNEYIITVDSSNNYESKQYSIDVSTIRDINIVNKNEEADSNGTITGEQLQNAISKYFEEHKDEFKGEPGENGVAPNIVIGEVTTLLPGSDATASFTEGEDGTLKLNLGIPKGANGEGGNGEPGSGEIVTPNIAIGEVVTLEAGSDATASFTEDMDGTLKLNLGIPRGANGENGAPGENGIAPNIVIGEVTTLLPGSGATANFTEDEDGTLKLNLGIPRGDKGEPGEPGSNSDSVTTPNITIGEVTTLEAGSNATANFTEDEDGTLKLNLGIPRGANGENGEPGSGEIVTPNIIIGEVTTLEAGSNATASFTEDNGTLKLNLGIPRGADGEGNIGEVNNNIEANPDLDGNEEILNSINIDGTSYSIAGVDETHYRYMYNDIHVIPDKYNTGIPNNVELETGSCIIDLNKASYKNLTGQIEFNNKDFTSDDISEIRNGFGYTGEGLKIIFNNCKFKKYRQPYDAKNVNIEFNNCSFMLTTTAFNSIFNKCFFGNFDNTVNGDACNPKMNCVLNDCYIANVVVKRDTQGTDHIDGSQVLNGDNIEFNNCRWECPDINYTYKQGEVAYALYLQNSTNCRINNCHINGGGNFSISCTLEAGNNTIKNTFVGECFISNAFYPTHKATIKNVDLFNSLYVSSVWKDENNYLHFLITNDTKIDREITVLTNIGITKFIIPRTYTANEYDADTKNFNDLPIDIEKIIESNVDYAVFFENGRQIRFVNFTDFEVVKNNIDTNNITIGEVTTLEAGSNATASFTEDEEGLKLNLGIPRGADGNGNGSSSPELTVPDSTDTDAKYDIYVSNGKLKLFKHDFTIPKSFNDQTAAATMLAMEPGINIGNSLDSYDTNKGFSEDGFLNQETRWMNPEITQEFVQKIKSLGFRSVRIPVTWYHNTYINENGERKVGKYFKARVREVVDWALDAGLYVVINAHFDAAKGFLFKIGETEEDFATILKDVEDVWSDIADKFKMYGEKLIFESFNEISTSNPAYGNIVTDEKNNQFTLLNQKFVDTVRATGYNNANRVLILQSMYTKQWHDAAKRFVVPTDTATNKLAYCMHPYTQLIGEQNKDFFRKLAACKSIIGLPMSFNEWGTVKKGMPTDTWRVKQAQDFVVRCFYISTNSQWWDNGSESQFKLLDRTGTEDKKDMISGLLASKSGNKPTWYIRPSKLHTLTGDIVQKGTWQADGTLSYKPTWGSISSPMYDIEGNKYAQYSCITMNEADEKIVVMAHIKYFDADGNLLSTTGSNAALSFPTLERLDTIPENAVKCCYTIYSKHNHLTYEQYRELINNKDLVCRVALFNGEEDMEQVTGDATTMNLRYTYWYANNKYNEVNGSIALVEDTNTTALQTPRRCLGNTKYNITVADYVDTNNLSIEILESNCDNIILQRHTLTSGTTSIITNENTSKLYFNIIGDSDFATNLGELYGNVSPISSFSDRTCTAFTVNSTDITLTILGQQFEISISNKTPSDSIVTPRYAISDDNIVSVTGNTITALKKGTATIFVYVGDAYQKINVTVDTSSSIIPIEYTDSINYFTADGVWQTSSGESGVKGIRVEPNATYSITRNGSYSAWCAAESNELASGVTLSNVIELDSIKTEVEYTTSSTAKYLLVSGANSKMKTLDIEKISGGNTGTGSNEENTGSGSDEGGTSEGDNTGSDNVDGP